MNSEAYMTFGTYIGRFFFAYCVFKGLVNGKQA